jgi:hypothetical protein
VASKWRSHARDEIPLRRSKHLALIGFDVESIASAVGYADAAARRAQMR